MHQFWKSCWADTPALYQPFQPSHPAE